MERRRLKSAGVMVVEEVQDAEDEEIGVVTVRMYSLAYLFCRL